MPTPITDWELITNAPELAASAPWELVCAEHAPAPWRWLDELDLSSVSQGWGHAHRCLSISGKPLAIDGAAFPRGIGTHSPSLMTVFLDGEAESFMACAGLDDTRLRVGALRHEGFARFEVWLDGQCVAMGPEIQGNRPPLRFFVDVRKAQRLDLIVNDCGKGSHWSHANWTGALVSVTKADTQLRTPRFEPGQTQSLATIAPRVELRLNGPYLIGASASKPILFKVPAFGAQPLHFSATSLPAGLSLNAQTGVIQGALTQAGKHPVTIQLRDASGQSTQATYTFEASGRGLSLTPPLGWNSWNVWGLGISKARTLDVAEALVKTGLADVGYHYVNIDDGWQGSRDSHGVLQPNEKMGPIREIADIVHGMGLKLGIYSSPGIKTCGGFIGSYGYEALDAETWAKWELDYLKYDWCSAEGLVRDNPSQAQPVQIEVFLKMGKLLEAQPRDFIYSICNYGIRDVIQWGKQTHAHLWRSCGDIHDTWGSINTQAFNLPTRTPLPTPGAWHDPDMLVVGMIGWGKALRPTGLTPNEQIVHLTLWCLLPAALLIGCDLTKLDTFTFNLLANPEAIAINQDPRCDPARIVWRKHTHDGIHELWARRLADNSLAIGLFNRGHKTATLELTDEALRLNTPHLVRDVWTRSDIGLLSGSLRLEIPAHAGRLLRLTAQ